jgi:hypothetical protein
MSRFSTYSLILVAAIAGIAALAPSSPRFAQAAAAEPPYDWAGQTPVKMRLLPTPPTAEEPAVPVIDQPKAVVQAVE